MSLLFRLLRYNGAYYLVSFVVFGLTWLIHSAMVGGSEREATIRSSSQKNADVLEVALLSTDAFAIKRYLYDLKLGGIAGVSFAPALNPHLGTLQVGRFDRHFGCRRFTVQVSSNGLDLGVLRVVIDYLSILIIILCDNVVLFVLVGLLLVAILFLSNLGTLRVLLGIEKELDLATTSIAGKDPSTIVAALRRAPRRGNKVALILIESVLQSFADLLDKTTALERETNDLRCLAAIGQTTAMLAHDVRKPFAVIGTLVSEMADRPLDPRFIAEALKSIEKSRERVESLIADTLLLAGSTKTEPKPISLAELVEEAIDEAVTNRKAGTELLARSALIPLDIRRRIASGYTVNADPTQLRRVLVNLIANALEAMADHGSLTISAESDDSRDGVILLRVANTGSFIEEEDISRIFEPFFTKGKKGGTGLGLAICKRLILNNGGSIAVASDRSSGTVFTIHLPGSCGALCSSFPDLARGMDDEAGC